MSAPPKQIRGIRQGIRSGTVLGRKSAGTGAVEEITIGELANRVIATGGVVTTGAANPQQWTAGPVSSLGANITISEDVLEVAQEWNAGTVGAIGTGLTLSSGTLSVAGAIGEWSAGTVTALAASLTLSSGTLAVTNANGMLPLVNGDTPGPSLMADPYGQCIGVFL
jgi:hypothetical protein